MWINSAEHTARIETARRAAIAAYPHEITCIFCGWPVSSHRPLAPVTRADTIVAPTRICPTSCFSVFEETIDEAIAADNRTPAERERHDLVQAELTNPGWEERRRDAH